MGWLVKLSFGVFWSRWVGFLGSCLHLAGEVGEGISSLDI